MLARALELAPGDLSALDQLVELDLTERNFQAAAERVQQQLRETPSSAGAYLLQGKIYFSEKRWDQAEAAFLKALELDVNLPGAYGGLVSTYVAADKVPQAIQQLQEVLAKNPSDLRALTSLGLIYDQAKDYARARETYEKILSIQQDPAVMNNLSYLYAERFNQLDKAYELARKARILEPLNPAVADTLGWIFYKQAQYQRARDLLQESVTASPNNQEIQFHFGMASYMIDEVEKARAALKKAVAAPGDFPSRQEARHWLAYLEGGSATRNQWPQQELEALVQQRPKDPVARTRLGEVYEAAGANEKAAAAYEAALNINPNLIEPTLRLAQLYAGPLHRLDTALALAKAARGLAPDDPRAAGILGRIAFLSGNLDWAYGLMVESARGRREDPVVACDLAWAAYSLGKIAEAERTMGRVVELASDPQKSAEARRFLALTNLEQTGRDLSAAQAEVEKVLQTDPGYVPALMIRAALEKQRGEPKNAITTYGDILQRWPDFAPAQKQLAALYQEDPATLDKASELAVKARKNLPDDPELASILGEISYARKEFAFAIQSFQESARRKPLRVNDLYYLGMSQLRTGQNAESRKTLEQALAAGLREPLSREAQAALNELRKGQGL
jgi:tetratricopeptide (TPR) repeat protein